MWCVCFIHIYIECCIYVLHIKHIIMVVFQIIRERMNHTEGLKCMLVLSGGPGTRLPGLSPGSVISQLCDLRQVSGWRMWWHGSLIPHIKKTLAFQLFSISALRKTSAHFSREFRNLDFHEKCLKILTWIQIFKHSEGQKKINICRS